MGGNQNAYNQRVVSIFSSLDASRIWRAGAGAALALAMGFIAVSQGLSQTPSETGRTAPGDRILLVLSFDNRTGQPSLDWIREAAAVILTRRFRSAGFAPMSRADRLYALDHLGLPENFQPSRASSLKLAETVDADSIVVGSYLADGPGIVAEARLVDVAHLRMSEPVTARGEMQEMNGVFSTLAWKLTRQLDPAFNVAQETFVAVGAGVPLDALQQYIQGITEPDQQERLRKLKETVKLKPDFGLAWMALGREDYAAQQYEDAAAAFAKVGQGEPDALEAGFYRGLSLLFSGDYAAAENAFASVARVLPLAEVLSNQGVALSRQGKDGVPLYRAAVAADPNVADYHFNIAVSLKRRGDAPGALAELAQCLKLRPNDNEAQGLERAWKGLPPIPDPEGDTPVKADPLERIARSFNAQAFRQAAQVMDEMEAARLATLPPSERAQKLAAQAKDYLDRGLLLEAERLYQSAVAADDKLAEAHVGMAKVRQRTGDAGAARNEARAALELGPSTDAYTVLGGLDLADGRLDDAGKEAGEALKLDPSNHAALELRRQIEARQGGK
jgi:tetratricopeptide (TPR) repeat protein